MFGCNKRSSASSPKFVDRMGRMVTKSQKIYLSFILGASATERDKLAHVIANVTEQQI